MTHNSLPDQPFSPAYGDRAGNETFAQIEAAVREALPKAPRLLQILIAGSAFMKGDQDGFGRFVGYEELFLRQEQEIAEKYGMNEEDANTVEFTDQQRLADNVEFLAGVHEYLYFLYQQQPAFIKNDIFGGMVLDKYDYDATEFAEIVANEPMAEPMRTDDAHPKRPYTQSEIRSIYISGQAQLSEFFMGARIEGFEEYIPGIFDMISANDVVVISGARGSGKTYNLLPKLAKCSDRSCATIMDRDLWMAQARQFIIRNRETATMLLLDEPPPFSIEDTELLMGLKNDGYDFKIVIIIGGRDNSQERKSLVGEAYTGPLQTNGFSVVSREIDFNTHINTEDAIEWLRLHGADQSLCDVVSNTPYLLKPRIFSSVFFGAYRMPTISDHDDVTSFPFLKDFIETVEDDLRDYQNPQRLSFPPKTAEELTHLLCSPVKRFFALEKSLHRHRAARKEVCIIDVLAADSGQYTGASYDEYAELCAKAGLAPHREGIIYTIAPKLLD